MRPNICVWRRAVTSKSCSENAPALVPGTLALSSFVVDWAHRNSVGIRSRVGQRTCPARTFGAPNNARVIVYPAWGCALAYSMPHRVDQGQKLYARRITKTWSTRTMGCLAVRRWGPCSLEQDLVPNPPLGFFAALVKSYRLISNPANSGGVLSVRQSWEINGLWSACARSATVAVSRSSAI